MKAVLELGLKLLINRPVRMDPVVYQLTDAFARENTVLNGEKSANFKSLSLYTKMSCTPCLLCRDICSGTPKEFSSKGARDDGGEVDLLSSSGTTLGLPGHRHHHGQLSRFHAGSGLST